MFNVGLDLGKRKSQVCVGAADGSIVVEKRLNTAKEDLSAFFANHLPARVLLEASTNAEWVASHLESLGVEVIVADPRFGPMYAQVDKRIKTDKRDSRALMLALRLGAYRKAHRRSLAVRDLRAELLVRAGLVRSRTRVVAQIRSLLDGRGIVLPSCAVDSLLGKLDGLAVDEGIGLALLPLVDQLASLGELIAQADAELDAKAAANPVARRLDEVVGVGTLTALAFVVAVEDPKRFGSAREVASYLGFVPRENSSGEKQHRGRTTKNGDPLARAYLIQAAWRIRCSKNEAAAALKAWMLNVEARRGKRVAVTAMARRLSRILFAIWRDDVAYDPLKTRGRAAAANEP